MRCIAFSLQKKFFSLIEISWLFLLTTFVISNEAFRCADVDYSGENKPESTELDTDFTTRWSGSLQSQKQLVKYLFKRMYFTRGKVKYVLKKVDRKNYVGNFLFPYANIPVGIGYGASISDPGTHATILENVSVKLTEGARVLDIGCGSGYLTACFGLMVGKTGKVVAVEHIPELLQLAKDNLKRDQPELYESGVVKFVLADGRLPPKHKYDVINVGAVCKKKPSDLIEKLRQYGRLVVGIGKFKNKKEMIPEVNDYVTTMRIYCRYKNRKYPWSDVKYKNDTGIYTEYLQSSRAQWPYREGTVDKFTGFSGLRPALSNETLI